MMENVFGLFSDTHLFFVSCYFIMDRKTSDHMHNGKYTCNLNILWLKNVDFKEMRFHTSDEN